MAATTFLTDYDRQKFSSVKDEDLNELFQEIRELFPQYYIAEHSFMKKHPLWKSKETTMYTLYIDFGGEAQIFSFPSTGISLTSNKAMITTYFYGLINGYEKRKKEELEKH